MQPSTGLMIFGLGTGIAAGLAQIVLNAQIKDARSIDPTALLAGVFTVSAVTLLAAWAIGITRTES